MAKKSFKENPALNFITQIQAPTSPAVEISAVPLKPIYVETRSRRLQLLIQPSLHQKLLGLAKASERSLNDLIHEILADFAAKN